MSLRNKEIVTQKCADCVIKIKTLYIRDNTSKPIPVGKICPKCKAVKIDY